MPTLVFPAPGCSQGRQFLLPFQSFDVFNDNGGVFVNKIISSTDLTNQYWSKGIDGSEVTALTPFNVVKEYTYDDDVIPLQPIYVTRNDFQEHTITSSSNTQFFKQRILVTNNTDYTFSFYAKRGTATNVTYGVYNVTGSVNIIAPTSYYSDINASTWTRITASFNTGSAEIIDLFLLWNISSGIYGSVQIFGPQLQIGIAATVYDPTQSISWYNQGLTVVNRNSYAKYNYLSSYSDPAQDFEPIPIVGQNKVKWNTVNEYLFDSDVLNYSSVGGNTVLYLPDQFNRPYLVGDTITVTNWMANYRQNFQVLAFDSRSVTINSTESVPINGSFIINPNPQVYPQNFVSPIQYRNTALVRENLSAASTSPNLRGVVYSLENKILDNFYVPASDKLQLKSIAVVKTVDRRQQGKIQPRTNIKTVPDRRQQGRIQPITNLELLPDVRPVIKIDQLSNTGNTLITRFTSGIPSRSGTVFTTSNQLIDTPLLETSFKLERYDNQGIYVDEIFNVTGQNNITTNTVNEYLFDLDVISTIISANGLEQTLTFNTPADIPKIYFPIGFYVRIYDSISDTAYIVQVTATGKNKITFDTIAGFPNRYGGVGLTLQSASSFVYPKSKVDSDLYTYISNNGLNLYNYPTNARENLSVSEIKPNFRPALKIILENNLGETLLINSSIGKMEEFQVDVIPGDFRTVVTAQSANRTNNLVSYYINDLDYLTIINNATTSTNSINDYIFDLDYLSVTNLSTTRTLFFIDQGVVPFPTGSQIRLINENNNSKEIYTVLQGTKNSVTISGNKLVFHSIIEKVVSSVYPQQYVSVNTAPTNARENLYYANIAEGLRANRNIVAKNSVDSEQTLFSVDKVSSVTKVQEISSPLTVNKVAAVTKLVSLSNILQVQKLRSAVVVKPDTLKLSINRSEQYFLQESDVRFPVESSNVVRPTINPTSPRENFWYFKIAPGYRSNSTLIQGFSLVNTSELEIQPRIEKLDIKKEISSVFSLPLEITNLEKTLAKLQTFSYNLTVSKIGSGFTARQAIFDTGLEFLNRQIFAVKSDTITSLNSFINNSKIIVVADKIVLETDQIDRYKTGDFKQGSTGITDVTFRKREPIQFWN